jgi:hypothetical protein
MMAPAVRRSSAGLRAFVMVIFHVAISHDPDA